MQPWTKPLQISQRRWHARTRIWANGNSVGGYSGSENALLRAQEGGLEMESDGEYKCGDSSLLPHIRRWYHWHGSSYLQ